MALYRTSFEIILKNTRLFSAVAQKVGKSWFQQAKQLPAFSALANSAKLNNEQWTKLRKEMLESKSGMKTPSLDVTIIQLCVSSKNLDLGKSYMKYLQENKFDVNTAVIGKYFQLLYNCKAALTDIDKKEILSMYDDLRLKHPLLDALTAESCILVISLTQRWKETTELLEMVKLSCTPSSASYSAIIISAFNNGEADIAWKYFTEVANMKKPLHSSTYISYLDYCLKKFKKQDICVKEIENLFHFIAKHDLMLDNIVMEHVKNTFQTLGWNGTFTQLNNVGTCLNCDHKLESLKLSKEDFSHLSKSILDKALVGDNVYFMSTPFEVKKFIKFVNKTKPYNIVIDGLNVAYKNGKHSPSNGAKQLATVVRYFLDRHQVVLVLGRKHMLRWDKQCMNYVRNNTFLFLTDDLSADDPCLLYATLASGPETQFVSGDLMRQHKFVLGDETLQRMFKRWQMSHQCFINFKRDKVSLIQPLSYSPTTQKGENCWHIPYRLSDVPLTDSYEPPSNWLCLKRV